MRALLIDDDINMGKVVGYQLQQQGYDVTVTTRGEDGLAKFKKQDFDIVISDIQMPDISGIDVLKDIRKDNDHAVVIMITAYGSVDNAVQACRLGADDYITKPFGKEQLLFTIEKALRLHKLQSENTRLKQELTGKFKFENMIAGSELMQRVLKTAIQVANSNASVLLLGESGTGKEVIAKAIHYNSPRKDLPLVTVNCPSIPENLLESELFGHVKGAFTGAIKDRKGKFELADGGTIFLDEIGDLREDLQAKLLRVLQEHEFDRVGDTKTIKVDVRIIAATNRNLMERVKQNKFREDLYYRLSVVPITIPPLRNRREDIPFLIEFFLKRYSPAQNLTMTADVNKALQNYDWPGNVRELENIIERLVTLSLDEQITMDDLPEHIRSEEADNSPFSIRIPEEGIALETIERQVIQQILQQTHGNQSLAARLLKIPRHVLLYRLKKLGLSE